MSTDKPNITAKLANLVSGWSDNKNQLAQYDFFPGALEVQERPPSPAGRWLLFLLLSLFCIGLAWASMGEVDIVVTAPGRVVPSGHVKIVQAPESGSVLDIHVSEGEQVTAGQVLISLDPIYAAADDMRVKGQLQNDVIQLTWRNALEQWFASQSPLKAELEFESGISSAQRDRARMMLTQSQAEISARLESFTKELSANLAEQETIQAERDRMKASLEVLTERVSAFKSLVDKQYGSRVQYLELLQQKTDLEKSLPVLASREHQLRESAHAITARQSASQSELRKQNMMEIVRLEAEFDSLQQESSKAQQRRKQLRIVSPINGIVQELSQHTIGGVVSAAQELMKIVPTNGKIEIEALLQNKDIGFISEGQAAAVKVDAFNFTKYGLLNANIVSISEDAISDENLGWVFKAQLELEQDYLSVEGKKVRLNPGMAITAEVKTGKRRLMEFFMSPLLRYRQESVRER